MENKIKLTIGAVITLALLMSGTYYVAQDDDAYYCEAKDMVMICEKLSSGLGTRCYFNETYKICKDGWKEIELGIELNQSETESIKVTAKKYLCDQIKCEEII